MPDSSLGFSRSACRVSAPGSDSIICVATSQINDEIQNGGGINVGHGRDRASQYRFKRLLGEPRGND